jgi:hypothetical protein
MFDLNSTPEKYAFSLFIFFNLKGAKIRKNMYSMGAITKIAKGK